MLEQSIRHMVAMKAVPYVPLSFPFAVMLAQGESGCPLARLRRDHGNSGDMVDIIRTAAARRVVRRLAKGLQKMLSRGGANDARVVAFGQRDPPGVGKRTLDNSIERLHLLSPRCISESWCPRESCPPPSRQS